MNGASNYWYSKCKINEAKFVKLKNEKQKLEESANSRILSLQWSLARSNERNEHLRSLVPPRIRDPSKFQKLGLLRPKKCSTEGENILALAISDQKFRCLNYTHSLPW